MRTTRLLALGSLFAATAFAASGPPWISIEYPANPYDAASRGHSSSSTRSITVRR